MMDDADLFHKAVDEHGGRLDRASLRPEHAASLDHVAGRARDFLQTAAAALPEMPPIYFDFIDNRKLNAGAFLRDGRYFIGVTRGALATLEVLFDRMLADPQILPFIGDPKEEVADLPLLPNLGRDFARSVDSVPEFPRPQDPARRATARKLGELALDFLTAHEFAHIANGHLDYLQANQGSLGIDELSGASWAPSNSESALINQVMEMDADGVAVQLSLSSEWGKVTGLFPRPGPEWDYVYSRPGMVSLQWSWAVSSL